MRTEIVYLRLEVEIGMLAIHTSEHTIASRLKGEVEIVTHFWKVEVCIEDILRHIMGIGAREADTIEIWDFIYLIKEFSERCRTHSP